MAAVVLAPGQFAVQQTGQDRRHGLFPVVVGNAQIFGTQQFESFSGRNRGLPAAVLVQPQVVSLFGDAVADEHQAGSAECNQFVGIYRQHACIPGSGLGLDGAVFNVVAGHPVIFSGIGQVLHPFAEDAAVQRGPALSGRSDEAHVEALLEGQRDQRGFSVTGNPFNAHVCGIYIRVGLQVVKAAGGTPGPCTQGAPVVRFARLALVHQADDPPGETGSVVGLDAGRVDHGIAPAGGEKLLVGRRILAGSLLRAHEHGKGIGRFEGLPGRIFLHEFGRFRVVFQHAAHGLVNHGHVFSVRLHGVRQVGPAEHHQQRNGPFGIGRGHHHHLDIYVDGRAGGVVHMAYELLGLGPDHAHIFHFFHFHRPGYVRHVFRYAAVHFALEILHDFRPSHVPPLFGGGDFLPGLGLHQFRDHREGIGFALVVVGGVGALLVCVEAAADRLDAQLVHHVLVVLLRRECHGLLCIGQGAEQPAYKQKE